jgi:hypothetical protein
MDSDRIIIWQKWADPFGLDDNENDSNDIVDGEPVFSDDDGEYETDDSKSKTDSLFSMAKQLGHIRVIATPLGIIPLTENTSSSKIFNFWTGHTNFDITKHIADIIEATDGVETLDIFTRYRFRVGIGKAFNDSQVMRDINSQVYKEL